MIYLASPCSHPDPLVRQARFDAACRITAELIRAGRNAFSPIVHGHPLIRFGLPTDWTFWQRFDQEYLRRCDEVFVLKIDGWQESEGVQAEVALASALGKRVEYLSPENNAISLSFRSSPHVAPVGHEAPSAADRPVGRTRDARPTSPVPRDDVAGGSAPRTGTLLCPKP
jgi:Domain of unknown function (DUF1937)